MQGARRSSVIVERLASALQQRLPSSAATGTIAPGSIDQWAKPLCELQPPPCLWPRQFSSSSEAVATARSDQQSDSHASAFAKLTPKAVVEKLDQFIIGQTEAKKAVAVAFRNRWRRHYVRPEIKDSISPKNILMIGPTGVGKTEIARRLAKLAEAPFVKVEATKFTEVGYHGKDVDSIIKDLLESSISLVRKRLKEQAQADISAAVEVQLLKLLSQSYAIMDTADPEAEIRAWATTSFSLDQLPPSLQVLQSRLRAGELEDKMVEVEMPNKPPSLDMGRMNPGEQSPMIINLDRLMGGQGRKEKRRLPVSEARAQMEEVEADNMFPAELINKEAIRLAEQDGIVFIDEIDKIVSSRSTSFRTGDPSSEGVQRDLLPIIEGSTVQTKHGNVNTDHILFMCSGAFHSCKPSDLMAELQGRLPIRVELKALTQEDFYRILTEPQYSIIKQQQMLLSTEGIDLHFTDAALREIACIAEDVNRSTENIGARRLASILERVVEHVSFAAPEMVKQAAQQGHDRFQYVVDKDNVDERVAVIMKRQDLLRWII
ncbi:P-loop containing nucleoside triphosphate hydrolase protein [Dunaliella salina]|uniref:P-loop containing nucleoside triphosphate hydrolase protein n=1 Tax=Dunaliella salina TaxID=3046 RepID=A0ABQ7G4V4_DUNSA|nr:P-loop containing nucleoside triphosphate hydrolase protein [Dunaliella salina]|eukprot:KAF5829636.1 P-loop containing nucleoside triphosphate hydrolase protein [Dunaliella salina]